MPPNNEQGGELIVTGHNKVKIQLKDYPYRIDVFFKKKHGPPPCDPHHNRHHFDELDWEVRRQNRGHHPIYTLHIKWKVSELREIVWLAYY